MVETALNLVLADAELVVTNLDPNCPTSHGTRPGAGVIVSLLCKRQGGKNCRVRSRERMR